MTIAPVRVAHIWVLPITSRWVDCAKIEEAMPAIFEGRGFVERR